jgi:uncharacterized protein
VDAVNVLLDKGADVNLATKDGSTALLVASNRGYPDIVAQLLKHGAKVDVAVESTTALMCACVNGYTDIAYLLIDAGIDIGASNTMGWTPLLQAAERGCYKILERLIEKGADVNVRSANAKWTPLMSASANGFLDIAEALIEAGADIEAQQAGGWTPLMIAVQAGETEIVRLLLKHHAKIFESKSQISPGGNAAALADIPDGALPMIGATLGGHVDIISLLLDHGANIEARTSGGRTALMIAASMGNKSATDVLLSRKAVMPIIDDLGYTMSRIGWVYVRGMLGAGSRQAIQALPSAPAVVAPKKLQKNE